MMAEQKPMSHSAASAFMNPKGKQLKLRLSASRNAGVPAICEKVSSLREAAHRLAQWRDGGKVGGVYVIDYYLRSHDIFVGSKKCGSIKLNGDVYFCTAKDPKTALRADWVLVYSPSEDREYVAHEAALADARHHEVDLELKVKKEAARITGENAREVLGGILQKLILAATTTHPQPANLVTVAAVVEAFCCDERKLPRTGNIVLFEWRTITEVPSPVNHWNAFPIVLTLGVRVVEARPVLTYMFYGAEVTERQFAEEVPCLMQAALTVKTIAQTGDTGKKILSDEEINAMARLIVASREEQPK